MFLKSILISIVVFSFIPITFSPLTQASDQEPKDKDSLAGFVHPFAKNGFLISKRKISVVTRRKIVSLEPDMALQNLFLYIDPWEFPSVARVSKSWNTAKEVFWRLLRETIKEDYSSEVDLTDKLVFTHLLRMKINTLRTLESVESLISRYPILLSQPRVHYSGTIDDLVICYLPVPEDNDLWASRGNPEAFQIKESGLENGDFGYERNLAALVLFIEKGTKLRLPIAAEAKVIGLANGTKGYQANLFLVRNFLKEVLLTPTDETIEQIISHVMKKSHPIIPICPIFDSIQHLEELVFQSDRHAIRTKFTGRIGGSNYYSCDSTLIPSDLADLMINKVRFAYALTAFGKLYGILGFERDVDAALFLIRHHKIAY